MKSKKGLTLAEILVVAALFSISVGIVFYLFRNGRVMFDTGEQRVHLQTKLRLAMELIKDDLRQADSSSIVLLDGGDAINFRMSVGVAGGSVVWGQPVTYSLNTDQQLVRTEGAGSLALADNITALQFTRPAPKKVHVLLTGPVESLGFRVNIREKNAL